MREPLLLLGMAWLTRLALLSLALATPAQALELSASSTQAGQALSLTPHVEILEDPEQSLTLAELLSPAQARRFQANPSARPDLKLGISRSAFWLRLRLHNPGPQPLQRMLDLGYAAIPLLDFYELAPEGLLRQFKTGTARPFASRDYAGRTLVFELTLPPGAERTLYLRLSSDRDLNLPLWLWEPGDFHAQEQQGYLLQALYLGILLALTLFNLLLACVLRDRIYLWYVAFASCMMLAMLARSGLAQQYLWPEAATRWSEAGFGIGGELATAAVLMFLRQMLDTATQLPRVHRLLPWQAGLHVLVALLLLGPWPAVVRVHLLLLTLGQLVQLGTALACARQGQRSAWFFLFAFVPLLLATATVSLRGLGLLPVNALTASPYLVQIGSAIEMILLALALADRFNTVRQRHAQAQAQLVEHLQSSERELEARVAQRTEELQQLNQRLEALSATDGLTGIANRRRFDQALADEWKRAERAGQPLALGLLDVDLFKRYNDAHGHPAGDACLRQIAELLAASVHRSGDLVARYGGEEFVFILPATEAASALAMAEKLREALHRLDLPHAAAPLGRVTVSIGIAALVPAPGLAAKDLIALADQALYQAKAQGRDRALCAGPDLGPVGADGAASESGQAPAR